MDSHATFVVEALREPDLLGNHHARAPSDSATRSCCSQSCCGALPSQVTLELGERGEHGDYQAAARAGRVNRVIQATKPDLAAAEIPGEVDQVAQAPPDLIQTLDNQDVVPIAQIVEGVYLQRFILTVCRDSGVADDHVRHGAKTVGLHPPWHVDSAHGFMHAPGRPFHNLWAALPETVVLARLGGWGSTPGRLRRRVVLRPA